jgi:DNA adenine methylase
MEHRRRDLTEKPFLKWVGGKTQIIDKLMEIFPKDIHNYYECFLGGGSVLLAVLSNKEIKISGNIYAYDINYVLIELYNCIKNNPSKLLKELKEVIKNETDNLEDYYYNIRDNYNRMYKLVDEYEMDEDSIYKLCSMFFYLNKTCFRGMYREGPNGFNVPYGNYKNPQIFDENHITNVSRLIQNVTFETRCFSEHPSEINENDFVYLDPPYAPETSTSFVKYNEKGFPLENHKKLFKLCNDLNCKFVLSNACVPLVLDSFNENDYYIEKIDCRRSINAKNPGEKTKEVLIKNF